LALFDRNYYRSI